MGPQICRRSGDGSQRGRSRGRRVAASAQGERAAADGAGHFKKSGAVLCEGADVKFAFIEEHLSEFPTATVCETLDVSRSGYYDWQVRGPSARETRREELAAKIHAIHQDNREVYGSPRVFQALKAQGEIVGENTVAKIMQ